MKTIFLVLVGFFFLIYEVIKFNRNTKRNKLPNSIKANYNKISIKASEIEVRSNEYFEQIESITTSVSIADSFFDPNRNIRIEKKTISILLYEGYKNKSKKYSLRSEPINLPKSEIILCLSKFKFIDIYIDPQNPMKHYFDLSFFNIKPHLAQG